MSDCHLQSGIGLPLSLRHYAVHIFDTVETS